VFSAAGALLMDSSYVQIAIRLLAALLAGGMIGLERSHRGRQAGFREHTLVCVATCQLMLIGVYDWHGDLIVAQAYDVSASRMIQGIMSGIGFLGAGGIIKEGFSVRGLTTAAAIWMTASIGVLIGVGFYFPALITTVLTLSTLTLFRWLEERVLHRHEVQLYLRQNRQGALHEPAVRSVIAAHGFVASSICAYGAGEGRFIDYKAVLTTADKSSGHRLFETLSNDVRFVEFSLVPLD
jgi:putative Mg2+ transporter-C (MgtC) family protein